jgi:hypothetical protein
MYTIGDVNACAMEDPVAAIKAAGYTNLTKSYIGASAYSYVFGGQFGYLDHAPTLWWGGECQPGAASDRRDPGASFSALRTGINVRPWDGLTSRVRWTIMTTISRGCTAPMRIGRRTTIRRSLGRAWGRRRGTGPTCGE